MSKTVSTTSRPAVSYRVPPLQISGVLSDILAKHFPNSSDSVQRSRRENRPHSNGQETSTTNSQSRIQNISQSNQRPVVRLTPLPLPTTSESNQTSARISATSSTQQAPNPLARSKHKLEKEFSD